MPNTLAHIGIQAIATRGLWRRAEFAWIFLGCIIPDVPWILQRIVRIVTPNLDPYDLRLYAITQSSLAVSLLLCGALATLSANPKRIFGVLAFSSGLHLLLDAVQTKFANGVHLFAPVSWELLNFGLFWPESVPTHLLTGLGLAVFAYAWWQRPGDLIDLSFRRRQVLSALGLLVAYLLVPLALLHGPEAADCHSVGTLRNRAERPGRMVEFSRDRYVHQEGGDILVTWAGEELHVVGSSRDESGTVSVRARFVDKQSIVILELYDHSGWSRSIPSYVGIALVLCFWLRLVGAQHCRKEPCSRRSHP